MFQLSTLMVSVSFEPCLFLWRDKICLSLLDELESLKRLGTIQCSSSYFVSEMIKTIRETRFYIVGNRFLFVFLCVRVLMCVSILSLKNILLILESLHSGISARNFNHRYIIFIYNYCHQSTSLVMIHDEVLVAPK